MEKLARKFEGLSELAWDKPGKSEAALRVIDLMNVPRAVADQERVHIRFRENGTLTFREYRELDRRFEKAKSSIEFRLEELRSAAGRKPVGRRARYDWEGAKAHLELLFDYHGELSADDPDWSCQADVVRAVAEYFQKEIGVTPADSNTRQHVSRFLRERAAAQESISGVSGRKAD